ncbi:MAG: cytochrome c biogenesis protein ResB [Candidatus Eremiobacteraeota bacterium]|nr:cytochrome c biogenesis protein ResB [Candidatus Eremiobacteraeota bacterium]MBV8366421.1 cytochrome c biogenesis protein ResB [Candidatus Eremiobacteraeota bacterium]
MSASAVARERGLYDQTLDLLSNVMFPVFVFAVWAALTLVGTSVDQNMPAQRYYEEYPAPMANAILRLHLTNVFHSWPYIALVLLLLLSMSVCTFRRVIPKRFPKDRALPIENLGLHAARESSLDFDATASAVEDYVARRGFAVRTQTIDGARWLFADKQKWARYGVLVAHVGFAVIAIGAFIGWLWGYRGEMQIYEGQTVSVPQAGLLVTLSHFVGRFEPVQTKAGVVYQASRFQSDVHVVGQRTDSVTSILVNHPFVTANSVYLYQASYGFGGNLQIARDGKVVSPSDAAGRLGPQDVVPLPGTSRVIEYGTMLGPSDPSQAPPGVPLPKADTYALWIFHDQIPTTQRPILLPVGATYYAGDGYTIRALPPVAWSGLTYRYDPGEAWVGVGALILTAGFVMALFFMPIKLYARVRDAGGAPVVDVAATTTKGNAMYEDDFNALVNGLAERLRAPQSGAVGETVNAYA